MLDTETKRRIDTARDILVGKVPDPKSQVEQITIALIYKFMDDMDAEVEELGGDRTFFAGDFAKYGWGRLMSPTVGGHELLNLYSEGISTMPQNAGIPALFRDIFKNAYLPYRDPETLKSFLKVIDGFTYDHSERLGDAFEYLLSVLGSQGDAGQFRTPRHIIDFMVEVLRPQKGEVILDPACGTAGFLISAYKHILRTNLDAQGNSTLTPDEKGLMATNFKGYDISPDMVRLSLVNLYLHGFKSPQIVEYDTLTSEDRWNEFADVILANPPFMSPKGGIKPHKRFSIKAKRSEVLFVDYMAEHLSPRGRAGIIVPEGIIFQSQTAYKDLRKMLVENSLVAVISLPAGVFNPYSGVKTSILILDKSLAKKTDKIAFFKVENDGFGLGAQRREVSGGQLSQVQIELAEYLQAVRNQVSTDDLEFSLGLIVPKEKIAANGEYNLSGERYKTVISSSSNFPMVKLQEVVENMHQGINTAGLKIEFVETGVPIIQSRNITSGSLDFDNMKYMSLGDWDIYRDKYKPCINDVLFTNIGTIGKSIVVTKEEDFLIHWNIFIIKPSEQLNSFFLKYCLDHLVAIDFFKQFQRGGTVQFVSKENLSSTIIPLPPISIQQEIVAEIEGYQKVINGSRAVIDNYRPHIAINADWDIIPLEEICEIQRGKFSHRPRNEPRFYGGNYPFIQTGDIVRANGGKITYTQTLNEDGLLVSKMFQPPVVVVTIAANIGDTAVLDFPSCFPDSVVGLTPKEGIEPYFLELMMRTQKQYLNDIAPQAAQKNINIEILKTVKIPVPSLETQKAIVAEIEAEQALVNANRELIERFEKKIQTVLNRIWGGE
ncbi:N-6 DNA methylase [Pseudanabaena sp. SR411]|uniref:N-6 DNA methylase n=1 Tax=Pseudanabaena sp. SR411 TaxID=1980935 RepID=UPI000B99335E|nr:N-6 DNA methylase [Pseudanabaena sp. SR411]OYQ62235.1 N-6 DNA methylase [Pseudanabaena sp. SR411]